MFVEDTLLGKEEFKKHAEQLARRHGTAKEDSSAILKESLSIELQIKRIQDAYELFSKD